MLWEGKSSLQYFLNKCIYFWILITASNYAILTKRDHILIKTLIEANEKEHISFSFFFFFYVDLFVHLENEQSDFKFVLLETEQLVHFNSLDSKSLWDMNLHKSWWYIWNFDIIWSYVALSATKCGFTRMRIEFVVVVASLADVSQKRFSNTHLFLLVT